MPYAVPSRALRPAAPAAIYQGGCFLCPAVLSLAVPPYVVAGTCKAMNIVAIGY